MVTRSVFRSAFLLLSFCLVSFARAETAAWSFAKNLLPATAVSVGGGDVDSLKQSSLWPQLSRHIATSTDLDQDPRLASLALLFRPGPSNGPALINYVSSMVVASDGAHTALYFSLRGMSSDAFARQWIMVSTGNTLKAGKGTSGRFWVYRAGNDNRASYVFSPANDRLVCLLELNQSVALQTWTAPGKASNRLQALLARTHLNATLWNVDARQQEIQDGITVNAQYGSLNFSGGIVGFDSRLITLNENSATALAASFNQSVAPFRTLGRLQPQVAAFLQALTITPTGREVVIRNQVGEKTLGPILDLALTFFLP